MNLEGGRCCPLCRQELVVGATIWSKEQCTLLTPKRTIKFQERQAALFDALWRRRPEFTTWEPLVREVWGYGVVAQALNQQRVRDTNRSPEVLHTTISRIRNKLQGTGIRVRCASKRELGWRITTNDYERKTRI